MKTFYNVLKLLSLFTFLAVLCSGCSKQMISVTSISFDKTTISLIEGETTLLTVTILPSNADNQSVIWGTNNPNAATVSNGTVTAVAPGEATITATTEDGGKTATCKVTVKAKVINVTSISLDKASVEIIEGKTATLIATVLPENATNKDVKWSTSDQSVATVSNGTVTAVAPGEATITATTEDGGKTATCKVTVKAKVINVTGVTLDKTSIEIIKGKSDTISATIYPENATNKNIKWSSSDQSVATVSNGKIEGIAPGNATIIVTTEDGNMTASCKVTVKDVINGSHEGIHEGDL